MTIRSSGSPYGSAQGDRITAAALEPLPALLTDERGKAAVLRMFPEGYPTVAEGLIVTGIRVANPPSDGAIADLAWLSPDGTARSVFTVGESYLSSPGTSLAAPIAQRRGEGLPPLLLWWALLHALSHIARYHSAAWTAALDPDRSRVAVPIEAN